MSTYTAATYGDHCAPVYDDWHGDFDEAAVATLAELAAGGRALELGVGTGRLALPLAARGVEVHGIDASPAMVERLRAKPGGADVTVTIGDFAGVDAEGEFPLVFVAFNTFFLLLTQDEQVRCFENVARRLTPGGVFLLETFVPDMTRYEGGQAVKATTITTDEVSLDVALLDAAQQLVVGHKIILRDGGIRLYPIRLRYAWPSEMDLMARLAGLRLRHRWGSWKKAPFTAQSGKHISVYEGAP